MTVSLTFCGSQGTAPNSTVNVSADTPLGFSTIYACPSFSLPMSFWAIQPGCKPLSILQPRSLLPGLIPVTTYTDATPHSVAAIIPTLNTSFAQAFQIPEEINRAEAVALLLGLQWASVEFVAVILKYIVTTVLSSQRCRKEQAHSGVTTTSAASIYLPSTLHGLRGNTFEILQVASAQNLADGPSRAVLQTLHRAARYSTLNPGEEQDISLSFPRGGL